MKDTSSGIVMQCFARVVLCLVLLFAQVFVRNGAAAMVVILLTCEAEMPSNRVGSSKQAAHISEGRCTALAHGRFTAAAAMAGFDHRAGGQTLFPVQHLESRCYGVVPAPVIEESAVPAECRYVEADRN